MPHQQARTSIITMLAELVRRPFVLCLLLAAITVAVFIPAFEFDFVNSDDPGYFSANRNVKAGLSWAGVLWAFRTHDMQSPYPVTWLSLMLDAQLFGSGPAGPHFTNVVLHALNALLLFLLLLKLTRAYWCSVFAAFLFALHPLHVECVAWISERKGLLSTLFLLLTVYMYALYAGASEAPFHQGPPRKAGPREPALRRALWYTAALGFFFLALLSKPMVVTLPCALLLLDYWPFQRFAFRMSTPQQRTVSLLVSAATLVIEKLPFFGLALAKSVAHLDAARQAGALAPLTNLPLFGRMGNAVVSYCRYLMKTVWPTRLAFPYPLPHHWPTTQIAVASLLLVSLIVLLVWQRGRRPWVFVGLLWFFGTLVPVIGIVQWGSQAMADRFTYVPHIGLFVAAVWTIAESVKTFGIVRPVIAVSTIVLLVSALRSRDQLQYWRNGETLARHAITVTRDNADAYNILGGYLLRAGRLEEAISAFTTALEINPALPAAQNNIGLALAARGELAKAIHHYDLALQSAPSYTDPIVNAGNAFAAQGRLEEARARYLSALQINPNLISALNNLGAVCFRQKNFEQALGYYRKAVALAPADANGHLNLGRLMLAQDRPELALESFSTAVALNPDQPSTLTNRANCLMALGRFAAAIQDYSRALQLAPTDSNIRLELANALVAAGSLGKASLQYQQVLNAEPNNAEAHLKLAKVLAKQGNAAAGYNELAAALRLKPEYFEAKQLLQEFTNSQSTIIAPK